MPLFNDKILEAILRYIIPALKKKKPLPKKESKLEDIVLAKGKEDSFAKNLSLIENIVSALHKNSEVTDIFHREIFVEESKDDVVTVRYGMERSISEKSPIGYKIAIHYEETSKEEIMNATVSLIEYGATGNDPSETSKQYHLAFKKLKEEKSEAYQKIDIMYEHNRNKERISIDYEEALAEYQERRQQVLFDFTNRVPGKNVDTFPASSAPGLLGFTYLGDNYMALRDDLIGETKEMVDVHESIHTSDEYETRVLTSWILERKRDNYIR